jgi:hypothetical protein
MSLIMLFEFLISLTDVYIAGKVGKEIQAACGFVIQLYFIFIVVANALTVGTVSVVSRLFAAGKGSERGRGYPQRPPPGRTLPLAVQNLPLLPRGDPFGAGPEMGLVGHESFSNHSRYPDFQTIFK